MRIKRTSIAIASLVAIAGSSCEREQSKAQPQPQTTQTAAPTANANIDPTQALLDGDFDAAAAAYAATGNWIGQAEVARARGDREKLIAVLGVLPPDLAGDDLRTAAQLAIALNPIPDNLAEIAKRACAAGGEDQRVSGVCARVQLGSQRELARCVEGCKGKQVIGFHLANFPVVSATVGGERGTFMLSSAGPSLLTPDFAKRVLGDREPDASWTTQSSGVDLRADIVLADVRLGDLKLADVNFSVMSLPDGFIDGALSPDELFDEHRVVVDMSEWEIRVEPSAPLPDGMPLARVGAGPALWGWVEGRPPRPFMLDFGNRHLTLASAYDQLADPLPVAQEVPMECAGGVQCTAAVVSPFDAQIEVGGASLKPRFAYIKSDLGESDPPFVLAPQALVGTGLLFGRVVTMDFGSNRGSVQGGDISTFEVGDEAAFAVTGSAVRGAPITWTERVHDVGTSVDIDVVMEGTDRSETWKMRLENDPSVSMRFLISSKPEAVWNRTSEGPVQMEIQQFGRAMSDIYMYPKPASGPTTPPEPLLVKQGDIVRRCLRVRLAVQLRDEVGTMMSMHCSGDPWAVAHVRVEDAEGQALMDYQRIGLSEPAAP